MWEKRRSRPSGLSERFDDMNHGYRVNSIQGSCVCLCVCVYECLVGSLVRLIQAIHCRLFPIQDEHHFDVSYVGCDPFMVDKGKLRLFQVFSSIKISSKFDKMNCIDYIDNVVDI